MMPNCAVLHATLGWLFGRGCPRVRHGDQGPARASGWRWLASAALLLATAGPAAANTGFFWVDAMTPQFAGYGYLVAIAVTEALALWRIAAMAPWRALAWCVGANVLSAVAGSLFTWIPLILLPAGALWLPFRPLLGDLNDPVNRLIAICTAFFLASVAVEGGVYLLGRPKSRRRVLRAALVGNAASNGIALVILLFSPKPYQATTVWQWEINNTCAADKALEAYRAEHNGKTPPLTHPLSVNEALLPYMRKEEGVILRDGKVVNYDRPRLRRDWPELRMALAKRTNEMGKTEWCVIAPEVPFSPLLVPGDWRGWERVEEGGEE